MIELTAALFHGKFIIGLVLREGDYHYAGYTG